jgi:hypothetical protein
MVQRAKFRKLSYNLISQHHGGRYENSISIS